LSETSSARSSISLRTPAKINLGLRLTGLRDDGYHLFESVFAPIEIFDDVDLVWRDGPDEVEFDLRIAPDAGLPPALTDVSAGPDNLVVRAAEVFREASGWRGQLRISLTKRIPAGAGMGGGSSDAGAVLAGLAMLAGDRAPEPEALEALGLGLGADIPYFLSPEAALVTGIGEEIEPIAGLPGLDLVSANPGIFVATAEVYRVADGLPDSLTAVGPGSTMRAISRLIGETGEWTHVLGDLLVNDLQPAATRLCPAIGRWLDRLRDVGAVGVGMSGSGGTVFGVFCSQAEAITAALALQSSFVPEEGDGSGDVMPWVRVTRTLSNS
jgi:4-diphosphocytidyl-2-C-methyl-D-erythritol kinase